VSSGTSRDVYAECKQLAEALSSSGERDAAQRLIDAIEAGSTSSEILFDLRGELDRLIDAGELGNQRLLAWASDLRAAVSSAVG
jgi:hypothetical protein